QISQTAVVNEAFYGNFLSYFTSDGEGKDIQNRRTWLHELPTLSTDGTNFPLTYALRATALAFCGIETANQALVQEAGKLYGEALHAHALLLQSNPKIVTVHMISTSVMLSLFEAMQSTTADAYRSHIYGAARMLEVTGPGQCQYGVLCQLFFHVRTQMAFIYLTTHKAQPVAVNKILSDSLGYTRLPIFQRLMSHIAALAEIYVNLSFESENSASGQQLLDLEVYTRVKSSIEALYHTYISSTPSSTPLTTTSPLTHQTTYRDGFTALTLSYFSAARILFSLLAPRFSATYLDFTDHYKSVLDCARFLKTKKIGCAYMRMATPLFLVALHAPREEQRREAMEYFLEWRTGSMRGISVLALETIRER
ncbi:hypothetical protein BCR34DRAFT_456493, partial [Clohesyomyces aquaticus]